MRLKSLVDLCLETIVDDIPRYNLVFNTTKDDSMKRRFEFLQRKYSFDILSRLSTKEVSLEEYVDLLINRYLKVLDTSWLRNCSWEKVISKMSEIGSGLEKMFMECFDDAYFPLHQELANWQTIMCYFPNLRSFTCQHICNDLILKNIARCCPNIQEIDIKQSIVTDDGVKFLCKNENGEALCMKLKKLFVFNSNVKDDGAKYLLKNLPSLEILDYPHLPTVLYAMHGKDISCLDKLQPYNIIMLNITQSDLFYKDIFKLCLYVCPRLKCLRCSFLTKDSLDFIYNLSQLEGLALENISSSRINIDELLKSVGGKLHFLSIKFCTISVCDIAESCHRVKKLKLNSVHFLLDNDSNPRFNSLSSISFANCIISKSLKAITLLLSSSTKLESLSFESCNLLSSEIKALILKTCELLPIKRISFCASAIEEAYIKALLFNCHSLRYLSVEGSFLQHRPADEFLKIAETLPNKPKIDYGEFFDTDSEESELDDDDVNDFFDESYYVYEFEFGNHEEDNDI